MNKLAPSKGTLFAVWAALLVLLLLTWLAAEIDLGPWNTVCAMSIAVGKMLLVLLVFMHIRYKARLLWVLAAAGLFWLFIMITLTLADYLTRG